MTDQALKAAVEQVIEAIDEASHGTLVIVTKSDLRTLLAALSSQASVMEEMASALTVIGNASERSETMFGGKMSEIARVFQHMTRVARTALSHYRTLGGE